MGIQKKPADDKRWYWRLPNLAKVVQPEKLDKLDNMDKLPPNEAPINAIESKVIEPDSLNLANLANLSNLPAWTTLDNLPGGVSHE
jgi:hypothetical protein